MNPDLVATDRLDVVRPRTLRLPAVPAPLTRDRLTPTQRRVADLLDAHIDGRLTAAGVAARLHVAGHHPRGLPGLLEQLQVDARPYLGWLAQTCEWDRHDQLCARCRRVLCEWWDVRDALAQTLTEGTR